MELSFVVGALHGVLLMGLTWHSGARLFAGVLRRMCAVFLMLWCNLAYTALVLASFSLLNNRTLYVGISLASAAALEALLLFRGVRPVPEKTAPADFAPGRFDRVVTVVLGVSLALAAIGSAPICYFYVPNNWDSLTYRFSRAFFYLGRRDLLHFGNPLDPRLLYYPFNGTLFYLFLAIHRFAAGWTYMVTCLAWVFAGLGSFFVAPGLGASRSGSFVAAWICLLSPSVLAQAASTNDEVLAAVPLLLALGFALEWFAHGRVRYAILAGVGLGSGFGSKLHWAFYALFAAGAAAVIAIRAVRSAALWRLPGGELSLIWAHQG